MNVKKLSITAVLTAAWLGGGLAGEMRHTTEPKQDQFSGADPSRCAGAQRLVPEGKYTAQFKPRVAVMQFSNANEGAKRRELGASVSGMLITYLKRKSQFVVLERDEDTLKQIEAEFSRKATDEQDPLALLPPRSRIAPVDALLQGQVTVLGEGTNQRVELDARLLGEDSKILSVSSMGGAISDPEELRAVVQRLGTDLEQGFLTPHFGNLSVTVHDPSDVRVFLTPILWECANEDERPPVERDRTRPRPADKWVTRPNVAAIDKLLAGAYTIRFERPGYDGAGPNSAENGRLVVVGIDSSGDPIVKRRREGGALEDPTAEQNGFIVRVRPLETQKWPRDGVAKPLDKRWGSIKLMVKREFLDTEAVNAADVPGLRSQVESFDLQLNDASDLAEDGEGDRARRSNTAPEKLLRRNPSCGPYSFNQVRDRDFVVSDYHQRQAPENKLPIGRYVAHVWLPQYTPRAEVIQVQNEIVDQTIVIELKRATGSIRVRRSGDAASNFNLFVEGAETKYRRKLPLDFEMKNGVHHITALPLDTYTLYNDLPGFKNWRSTQRLLEPTGGSRLLVADNCLVDVQKDPAISVPGDPRYVYLVKMQPWLAGRLEPSNRGGMRSFFNPNLHDRDDITELLDNAIAREEEFARKSDKRRPNANDAALLVSPAAPDRAVADNDPLQELRGRLGAVDLLYLNDTDTRRIAALPKLASLVHEYIEKGGAVFALVSSPADYSTMFGASIPVDAKPEERGEIEVRPGTVPGIQIDVKIDTKAKRSFPMLSVDKKNPLMVWRPLAYRKKGQKEPILLEQGEPDRGGYVLVWVDTLANFDHEAAKEALGAAEKRALTWSQHIMFRRFGPDSPEAKAARDRMLTLVFSVRKEVKGN